MILLNLSVGCINVTSQHPEEPKRVKSTYDQVQFPSKSLSLPQSCIDSFPPTEILFSSVNATCLD